MAIRVKCACGRTLAVRDEAAGKTGKCPACGQRVTVPIPDALDRREVGGDSDEPVAPGPEGRRPIGVLVAALVVVAASAALFVASRGAGREGELGPAPAVVTALPGRDDATAPVEAIPPNILGVVRPVGQGGQPETVPQFPVYLLRTTMPPPEAYEVYEGIAEDYGASDGSDRPGVVPWPERFADWRRYAVLRLVAAIEVEMEDLAPGDPFQIETVLQMPRGWMIGLAQKHPAELPYAARDEPLTIRYVDAATVAWVYTDADGRYAFRDVSPGRYRLYARFHTERSYVEWLIPVVVSDGRPIEIDLTNANAAVVLKDPK